MYNGQYGSKLGLLRLMAFESPAMAGFSSILRGLGYLFPGGSRWELCCEVCEV